MSTIQTLIKAFADILKIQHMDETTLGHVLF